MEENVPPPALNQPASTPSVQTPPAPPLPPVTPIGQSNTNNNAPSDKRIYPELIIPYNEHPKRLYAFPLLAYLIKVILILPQAFILAIISLVIVFCWLITPFVTLFTGKLWNPAYKYTLIYLRFSTKMDLWLFGLTDKYPGFSMDEGGLFTLNYAHPETSSRLLAFPVLGFVIRTIILIPYSLFENVMEIGANIALFCSWFIVLFTGRYPESIYEFIKDYLRVKNANFIYNFYLSDTYPSFRISMHHKAIKIILLVLAGLLLVISFWSDATTSNQNQQKSPYSTTTPVFPTPATGH